jgi:serine/threonine-protein kinase RsbW
MLTGLQEVGSRARDEDGPGECWLWQSLSSAEHVPAVLGSVEATLAEQGYPPKDRFAVRLALEEAVLNALHHGNRREPAKRVFIALRVNADGALAEVEDQGAGFDPTTVPDPTAPENVELPGGRGLLLMRSYMTWVRYNERGNQVTLYKRRSVP